MHEKLQITNAFLILKVPSFAVNSSINRLINTCLEYLMNIYNIAYIGGGRGQWLGGTMASAEHEPITGVWGQSPQRGPGAEPLVRGA